MLNSYPLELKPVLSGLEEKSQSSRRRWPASQEMLGSEGPYLAIGIDFGSIGFDRLLS